MTALATSRKIPATVQQVFAAISHPERLSKWWGPAGFTNTFAVCEFKNGGRWSFTMHGPDGKNYPNENKFKEINSPHKVIIEHVSEPQFLLTITLTSSLAETLVSWLQEFKNPAFASSNKQFLITANEQNLDRLTSEVLAKK